MSTCPATDGASSWRRSGKGHLRSPRIMLSKSSGPCRAELARRLIETPSARLSAALGELELLNATGYDRRRFQSLLRQGTLLSINGALGISIKKEQGTVPTMVAYGQRCAIG